MAKTIIGELYRRTGIKTVFLRLPLAVVERLKASVDGARKKAGYANVSRGVLVAAFLLAGIDLFEKDFDEFHRKYILGG
ncbi:MAG: hypothetical protein ACPLOC_03780 [Candidatus Bathyarchaeales archaeon]